MHRLSPVVQAAADLIEPVAKSVDDRLLLLVGALQRLGGDLGVQDWKSGGTHPGLGALGAIGSPAARPGEAEHSRNPVSVR